MSTNPSSSSHPPLPPFTLIVASTPTLGIGLNGSLPWPPLKADLQFFARVTKRPPPPSVPTRTPEAAAQEASIPRNAVVMGRKTYDSIPPRFRPLKGRCNVVITRSPDQFCEKNHEGSGDTVVAASSIVTGLQELQAHGAKPLGRVFVIGGAEIYKQVLGMRACERVLWTRLSGEWECDTWFPEGVVGDGVEEGGEGKGGWRRRTRRELEEWVGEEGVGGVRREGEVEFEVSMWERDREGG
ncbi:MAG: hypothetical protein Q9184_006533 [Pyrenodesmia sp. 2 TL-2023]